MSGWSIIAYGFLALFGLTAIGFLIAIFVPRGRLPSTFPSMKVIVTALLVELAIGVLFGVPFLLIVLNYSSESEIAAAAAGNALEQETYKELQGFYQRPIARSLEYILEDIDRIKHKVDTHRDRVWYILQIGQVMLIILGALSTAMVAVGNKLPHVAPWVILPTTLVTIISGINAFYDYAGKNSRLTELRSSLAEMQGKVIFDVNLSIAKNDQKIAQKEPDEYLRDLYGSLNATLARYEQGQQIRFPQSEPSSQQDQQ